MEEVRGVNDCGWVREVEAEAEVEEVGGYVDVDVEAGADACVACMRACAFACGSTTPPDPVMRSARKHNGIERLNSVRFGLSSIPPAPAARASKSRSALIELCIVCNTMLRTSFRLNDECGCGCGVVLVPVVAKQGKLIRISFTIVRTSETVACAMAFTHKTKKTPRKIRFISSPY